MSTPGERHQKLEYRKAIERPHLYASACDELRLILNNTYSQLPKTVQAAIFRDVLLVFRHLSVMQSSKAVSAAHRLSQGVEAILPKQKKNVAVKEFRLAMIAQKRSIKSQKDLEFGMPELPEEILQQIFSLLDVQSLVASTQVCRTWNIAANVDSLWKSLYDKAASAFPRSCLFRALRTIDRTGLGIKPNSWKQLLKYMYGCNPSELLTSNRGYCSKCQEVVWLENMTCPSRKCREPPPIMTIKYMLSSKIPKFLLYGLSSDSDSDSEYETESDEEFSSQSFYI